MKHSNVSVVGHVDCRKTTLTQALIESGEAKKQPTREPQNLNLPFKYAWVLERLRCTGKGITTNNKHGEMLSKNKHFTIIDCPGHRYFMKNTVAGTAQADVIMLVVSADDQFTQYALIALAMGIEHLICCCE